MLASGKHRLPIRYTHEYVHKRTNSVILRAIYIFKTDLSPIYLHSSWYCAVWLANIKR